MKNWIIFISVFILSLSLVITVLVLWKANAPFHKIEQQAEQLALDPRRSLSSRNLTFTMVISRTLLFSG